MKRIRDGHTVGVYNAHVVAVTVVAVTVVAVVDVRVVAVAVVVVVVGKHQEKPSKLANPLHVSRGRQNPEMC